MSRRDNFFADPVYMFRKKNSRSNLTKLKHIYNRRRQQMRNEKPHFIKKGNCKCEEMELESEMGKSEKKRKRKREKDRKIEI
jgi:hypothetical protein